MEPPPTPRPDMLAPIIDMPPAPVSEPPASDTTDPPATWIWAWDCIACGGAGREGRVHVRACVRVRRVGAAAARLAVHEC